VSPRNLDPALGFGFGRRLARGVLVTLPRSGAKGAAQQLFQSLPFQYNPESITRTRSGQWEHKENKKAATPAQNKTLVDGQRGGGLYAKSETINIKIVFDATEAILRGDADPNGALPSENGVLPELAVLERMALAKEQTEAEEKKTGGGEKLESLPPSELLLVLGPRKFPVVITAMNIVEQRFTPGLVPIRAEVDLRFRVLEVSENAADKVIAQTFKDLMERRKALSEGVYPASGSDADAIAKALGDHTGEGIT
jgi:hypothetical protein